MIVAHEMEDPVDQEVGHLAFERTPRGAGLGPRGLHGDVDLSEKERAVSILEVRGLGERKGKNVGGAIHLEEIAVQDPDPRVVREDQRDRGAGKPQAPERAPEKRPKSCRS